MHTRHILITIAAVAIWLTALPEEAEACYPSCSSSCNSQSPCSMKCDGLVALPNSLQGQQEAAACNTITCGDHGICVGQGPVCGDYTCQSGESCSNCPSDCGSCNYCGNGTCSGSETCASCPGDCGSCYYWTCSGTTPWKYANASISWYNNGVGDYHNILQEEAITDSNSWHSYTDINFTQVFSSGISDHLNAYSGFYGYTGWLGLATVYRNLGCVIREGHVVLNRSYLDSGSYTRTNRKHVACQEIGHLLGLGHNTTETNTCMNDSILSAPQPNTRARDAINAIY